VVGQAKMKLTVLTTMLTVLVMAEEAPAGERESVARVRPEDRGEGAYSVKGTFHCECHRSAKTQG
jgi:hypothetical protein